MRSLFDPAKTPPHMLSNVAANLVTPTGAQTLAAALRVYVDPKPY
jgi:hypothetical protein